MNPIQSQIIAKLRMCGAFLKQAEEQIEKNCSQDDQLNCVFPIFQKLAVTLSLWDDPTNRLVPSYDFTSFQHQRGFLCRPENRTASWVEEIRYTPKVIQDVSFAGNIAKNMTVLPEESSIADTAQRQFLERRSIDCTFSGLTTMDCTWKEELCDSLSPDCTASTGVVDAKSELPGFLKVPVGGRQRPKTNTSPNGGTSPQSTSNMGQLAAVGAGIASAAFFG